LASHGDKIPPLRVPACEYPQPGLGAEDPGLEERCDQRRDASIGDPLAHPIEHSLWQISSKEASITTRIEGFAAALRAHAAGMYCAEAAVELLIGYAAWLRRSDFRWRVHRVWGCKVAAAMRAWRLPFGSEGRSCGSLRASLSVSRSIWERR
jgi:hypothetical protein